MLEWGGGSPKLFSVTSSYIHVYPNRYMIILIFWLSLFFLHFYIFLLIFFLQFEIWGTVNWSVHKKVYTFISYIPTQKVGPRKSYVPLVFFGTQVSIRHIQIAEQLPNRCSLIWRRLHLDFMCCLVTGRYALWTIQGIAYESRLETRRAFGWC